MSRVIAILLIIAGGIFAGIALVAVTAASVTVPVWFLPLAVVLLAAGCLVMAL
jgi:dipeptide/tripeptide permease